MSTGPDPRFKIGDRVRRTRHPDWTGTVRSLNYEPAGMTLHGPIGAAWFARVEWDEPNAHRCKNWSVTLLDPAPAREEPTKCKACGGLGAEPSMMHGGTGQDMDPLPCEACRGTGRERPACRGGA